MWIFTHVDAVESAVMLGHCEAKYRLVVFDYLSALARVKRCFGEVINVGLDRHWYPPFCAALAHF